jgi:hypothetical protein
MDPDLDPDQGLFGESGYASMLFSAKNWKHFLFSVFGLKKIAIYLFTKASMTDNR